MDPWHGALQTTPEPMDSHTIKRLVRPQWMIHRVHRFPDMKFDTSKVKPINLYKHIGGEFPEKTICGLECDPHEVARTGVDPCNAGSREDIPIKMSCFSGGDKWIKGKGGSGLCAFPCQLATSQMEVSAEDQIPLTAISNAIPAARSTMRMRS